MTKNPMRVPENCSRHEKAVSPRSRRGNEADSFPAADEVMRGSLWTMVLSASSRRRLPGLVATDVRKWIPFFLLFLTLIARAQTFTNSATLSASIDGTNLVIAYSLANTQGWVTLFQADRPETSLAQSQPMDYAPAPLTGHGEYRVPLDPAAPTKFYRLLIEQWLTRGKALVLIDGPVDFAAMRQTYGDITNGPGGSTPMIFKQPVGVWLDHLGVYDPETGVQIGGNGGVLNGKYGNTELAPLNPPLSRVISSQNDFRIDYLGSGVGL